MISTLWRRGAAFAVLAGAAPHSAPTPRGPDNLPNLPLTTHDRKTVRI